MGAAGAPYEAGLSPTDLAIERYAANPRFVDAVLVGQWLGVDPEVLLASPPDVWIRRLAQMRVVMTNLEKTPRGRPLM